MSISKKKRFEIFKRDNFTCQYCGKVSPQVVLEVDHIIPKSKKGSDKPENLITSCFDCNRGKGANSLGDSLSPLNEVMEKDKERQAQVDAYNRWLRSKRTRKQKEVRRVSDAFIDATNRDPTEWVMCAEMCDRAEYFLDKLAAEKVVDAAIITARFANKKHWATSSTLTKYFCGVCWKMIKESDNE